MVGFLFKGLKPRLRGVFPIPRAQARGNGGYSIAPDSLLDSPLNSENRPAVNSVAPGFSPETQLTQKVGTSTPYYQSNTSPQPPARGNGGDSAAPDLDLDFPFNTENRPAVNSVAPGFSPETQLTQKGGASAPYYQSNTSPQPQARGNGGDSAAPDLVYATSLNPGNRPTIDSVAPGFSPETQLTQKVGASTPYCQSNTSPQPPARGNGGHSAAPDLDLDFPFNTENRPAVNSVAPGFSPETQLAQKVGTSTPYYQSNTSSQPPARGNGGDSAAPDLVYATSLNPGNRPTIDSVAPGFSPETQLTQKVGASAP